MNGDDRLDRKTSTSQKPVQRQWPIREPSKQGKETPVSSSQQPPQHHDDTMGHLKRTFAGIFGEVQ